MLKVGTRVAYNGANPQSRLQGVVVKVKEMRAQVRWDDSCVEWIYDWDLAGPGYPLVDSRKPGICYIPIRTKWISVNMEITPWSPPPAPSTCAPDPALARAIRRTPTQSTGLPQLTDWLRGR